ncbi:unnamed protein product [Tuber aestivum]|uniref:C2H2-type domain-containing protein n=1 Tax=Tuber aestivum TaxID=59557 RepID=A0A292Q0F6_9PEZI|nr:unnamed protein product [Tuber aestivum]
MDGLNWTPDFLPLWPDSNYRREFARSLSEYIIDRDRKYPTAEPGMWDPDMPLPPKVRSYFSDCVKQFVESLFDELFRRHQPEQFVAMEDNYALERFLHQPYPNEEPFNPMALTTLRENQSHGDTSGGFNGQSPSTADPRRPIRELHRQGAVHQADLFQAAFSPDVFARGTHGANLAEQMETVTEIMSSRKSYVEPLYQEGALAPPPPQYTVMGSHNSGRPGGSALGRRRRACSGEESASAGSQTAARRTKTKRNQPPPKTALGGAGQSSRSLGANVGSVDENPRNTSGAGTGSKESFKHECEQCGERFEFPARLKSHMETISHAERKYQCDRCGSVFSRKSSLKRHLEAATACKSKVQSGNDSPPPSASESGARDAAFRSARPPSIASPSHGDVSPSIAGDQSVSSRNQYRSAFRPRAPFGGDSHLSPMARVSSQQHRPFQPSVASRSSHRPSSAHSYINPKILQEMSDGYNN